MGTLTNLGYWKSCFGHWTDPRSSEVVALTVRSSGGAAECGASLAPRTCAQEAETFVGDDMMRGRVHLRRSNASSSRVVRGQGPALSRGRRKIHRYWAPLRRINRISWLEWDGTIDNKVTGAHRLPPRGSGMQFSDNLGHNQPRHHERDTRAKVQARLGTCAPPTSHSPRARLSAALATPQVAEARQLREPRSQREPRGHSLSMRAVSDYAQVVRAS